MTFRELNNKEFDAFVNSYPLKSVFETTEYGSTMNGQKEAAYYLGLIDDQNMIVGATLLLIKKDHNFKYGLCPRGPLLDYRDKNVVTQFSAGLMDYAKKNSLVAVKINPLLIKSIYDIKDKKIMTNPEYQLSFDNLTNNNFYHLGYNNYFEALKPRFEAILDIGKDDGDIFLGFEKETKTKIRSAISKGVVIYKGDEKNIPDLYKLIEKKYHRDTNYFYDLYAYYKNNDDIDLYYAKLDINSYLKHAQSEYNRFMLESQKFNELVISNGDKATHALINKKIAADKKFERAKRNIAQANTLATTNPDGLLLAAMLILKNGNMAYIIMDGMDPRFKSFNAKQLLTWAVIQKYTKRGITTLNMGGCSNPTLKDNKFAGLNEYKTNYGARIYEYAGDFELIVNKPLYFMYHNAVMDDTKK
jgi:lipid II:glycine glycyltransferase (peptidoglycan interpeptide bridge formation enzyme)